MGEELQHAVEQLHEVIKTMLNPDPQIPYAVRTEAYQKFESFREGSPLCAQAGVIIAKIDNDPIMKHLGIQLVEHCVRVRWHTMDPNDKTFVKDNALQLLIGGTRDIMVEQKHIKDAVTRLIVEIIKREWPYHWTNMIEELDAIYRIDPTRCELVLLVFLRLMEDVLVLQNMQSSGRRKDIVNALSTVQPQLFSCFILSLRTSFDTYMQNKAAADVESQNQSKVALRLSLTILETIVPFLDWVAIGVIMASDGALLQMLCAMLKEPEMRLHAAECLLIIISRKGKDEDRQPLLVLFHEEAMTSMVDAAVTCAATALTDKTSYTFLKKLCQVLVTLGTQLCHLWTCVGSGKRIYQPPTFVKFLEAIFAFTTHPSKYLAGLTQSLWQSMFKHEIIRQDETFRAAVPRLIQTIADIIAKVGYPSQSNSKSCSYSRLDFDGDEEFTVFFTRFRIESSETLKLAALHSPAVAYTFVSGRVANILQKPIDCGGQGDGTELLLLSNPSYIEWEVTSAVLEFIMTSIFSLLIPKESETAASSEVLPQGPTPNNVVDLFKTVLHYETKDASVRTSQLSMISTLFPIINIYGDLLPTVLQKLFDSVVFSVNGDSAPRRSRSVRAVRKHACSILIKISKCSKILLPVFDQLYAHVKQISSDPRELSVMEKLALIESLILVSNQFRDFNKQSAFLSEIMTSTRQVWFTPEFKEITWNVERFIGFVGLDKPESEFRQNEQLSHNRHQLLLHTSTLASVLRRSVWPESIEEAVAGGFSTGTMDSHGKPVLRNPATRLVLDMFENILALNRTVSLLYLPENRAKCHTDYTKSFDMSEIDKMILLGQPVTSNDIGGATDDDSPTNRMRLFIVLLHENCVSTIGMATSSIGYEFYQLPNLAASLISTIIAYFRCLPDYRLRLVMRSFLRNYVLYCPKEFLESAVLPVFVHLAPYMYAHLIERWQIIEKRYIESCAENNGESGDHEDGTELQEIIENQDIRLLTREYIDLIRLALAGKRTGAGDTTAVPGSEAENVDDEMQEENTAESETVASGGGGGSQIECNSFSDLGQLILHDKECGSAVIVTLFKALSWRDSTLVPKCTTFCFPIVKLLVSIGRVLEEDVNEYLVSVLMGLQIHGQHDASLSYLLSAAVHIYNLLCPMFPSVRSVMLQIPGCTDAALLTFESRCASQSNSKPAVTEKRKRDWFKDLVQPIIGKNIGQMYQYDKGTKKDKDNISGMFRHASNRYKPPHLLELPESTSIDIGLCALFAD